MMEDLKSARNIAVLRSKGGSGEHRAVKEICDHLLDAGMATFILRAREDNKYDEPRSEEPLPEIPFPVFDEDSGPLPYPYAYSIKDAQSLNSSNSIRTWENWEDVDVRQVNEFLPNHKVIYTLGLGSGASIATVEKALSLFDKVFITVNLDVPYCVDRALEYVRWDPHNNREQLRIFAWSKSISESKAIYRYEVLTVDEWEMRHGEFRKRSLLCL